METKSLVNWIEVLNDIVSIIEPENVPVEYIVMAKYINDNGIETSVRGSDLERFMSEPKKSHIHEAKIIVDIGKIKKTMLGEIVHFFDTLNAKT